MVLLQYRKNVIVSGSVVDNSDLVLVYRFANLAVQLSLLCRVHGLVLLVAGQGVVGPAAAVRAARVRCLPGIVNLKHNRQVVGVFLTLSNLRISAHESLNH